MSDQAAAGSSAPPNLATPRYPLLDSMRGIAALSVFFAHVAIFTSEQGIAKDSPLVTRLDPGIGIFLLLSGFLIYRPFAQARYDGSEPPALIPFAIRRAVRVLPVYWLILPLVALYFGMDYVFTADGIVRYFGFLQIYDADTITKAVGQAWTLCGEITFYIFLPVWAVTIRRVPFKGASGYLRTELIGLGVVFVLSGAWKLWGYATTPEAPGVGLPKVVPELYTLPAYLDVLAVGMALAAISVVLADGRPEPRFVRFVDRVPWLFAALAFGFWWLTGLIGGKGQGAVGYLVNKELILLASLSLFVLAIFGNWRHGLVRRLMHNRPLTFIATISYGFYLIHLAVMVALVEQGWLRDPGPVAWTIASFVITTVLATLAYYAVGRPFLKLGARVPRGRSRRRLAKAGAEVPSVPAREGP